MTGGGYHSPFSKEEIYFLNDGHKSRYYQGIFAPFPRIFFKVLSSTFLNYNPQKEEISLGINFAVVGGMQDGNSCKEEKQVYARVK